MKKILSIAMLVMIFILSSCSLNEGSLKESSSEDLSVAPSQQEETTHAEIEGEQGSHEGTESQSPSIQAKDIQVEPIALIEELENVHSQREGYPYTEITSASADNIFFLRGAIPTGDVYGTVDELYRYDMKTKEIVPEIENEAKKRVMKVVLRDQFKYILKIDVERNEFILLKEDLSTGQVKELIQDLVLDPYTHSPTLIEKAEDIYFIYPHRDEESSYLNIYNLAIDEKKPIFKEAFRVTNFESAREGVDDLGIMMTDASDHAYLFLS